MVLITVSVTFMLMAVLTNNLKRTLSLHAYHDLDMIEHQISFLAEHTKYFSRNHFVINSLIDPQGRNLYLPNLIEDFSTNQDIYSVTIVDFEGNIIKSNLENPPDYREKAYLRYTLAVGESGVQMSTNNKNVIFVEPVEYYQTPQGAVIVEFNLKNLVSRILHEEEIIFHKLHVKKNINFIQNFKEDEKYFKVEQQAGKENFYMNLLGMKIEIGALKSEYLAPVKKTFFQLIAIEVLFIAIAVIITTRIGNGIARPILLLCKKISRSAAHENEKCSPVGTGDELEELAQVFDRRTEQLIMTKKNLEEYNKQLKKEIGDRIRVEKALRKSQLLQEKTFASLRDAVFIIDADKLEILDCNPAVTEIFGYSQKELLGKTTGFLNVDEEAYENFKENLYSTGEENDFLNYSESQMKHSNGTIFNTEQCVMLLKDEKKNRIGWVNVVRDITERKRLEEQLRHSQKMEAVGRLAGGVAHDFNNLLTAIIGYSEILKMQGALDNNSIHHVNEILNSANRAANLTQQLLAFSRKQVLQPKIIDLNELIIETEKLLRRLIGEDINLLTGLDPELGHLNADPGQIEQVIVNLSVNARDAMPDCGKLTIETNNVYLDESYCQEYNKGAVGDYICLSISDTGHGMDKETKEHIFEPFFTTKEAGKGTGLGLSMVYGIVRQSGGYIWVYSEINHGTTFKIYLPRIEERDKTWKEKPEQQIPEKGTETIMVVEDEEMVRNMISDGLKQFGYTIIEAGSGIEAVAVREGLETGSIDLLITDVIMPEMNGKELVKRFYMNDPDLKVMFISGYPDNAIMHHGVLDEGVVLLQKPFSPRSLALKVREVLDSDKQ